MQALSARPRVAAPARTSRRTAVVVRAEEGAKAAPAKWTPPALDASAPAPRFGGSTGGLLRKAQVEEFYVLTWTAKKEVIFEMPTGGAAVMNEGKNLLKLARKEQCLAVSGWRGKGKGKERGFLLNACFFFCSHATPTHTQQLLTQLRSKFKVADGEFYRVFPNGEVQYLYPSQGTPSERVNAGRTAVNTNARRIGENKDPAQIKFTGKLGAFDV